MWDNIFEQFVSLVCHDGEHLHACIVEHAGGTHCSSCPPIISRFQWDARKPTKRTPIVQPIHQVFIHQTDESSCIVLSSCALRVKSIQNYHMDTKGMGILQFSGVLMFHTRVSETLLDDTMSTSSKSSSCRLLVVMFLMELQAFICQAYCYYYEKTVVRWKFLCTVYGVLYVMKLCFYWN